MTAIKGGVSAMRGPQRQTQTRVDTIIVSPALISTWKVPPFQRPIRTNSKVLDLVETLRMDGGVLPGILTIGILEGATYIVDGQHRVEAFRLSELAEGFTDVRYRYYETMAEMAEDFVRLNSQLVKMRPDDILRGLEGTSKGLQYIRELCPFVGYDQIRRGPHAPMISASMLLRAWTGAVHATPRANGQSSIDMLRSLSTEEAAHCVEFLLAADKAWGRDQEYARLWGLLNMTLCMWIYRRTVLTAYSAKVPKLSKDLFRKCLIALSATSDFVEWLVGRNLTERDRSPAYGKIKTIFVRTIERELGKKVSFPKPEWAS